jgi:hypothetical protein
LPRIGWEASYHSIDAVTDKSRRGNQPELIPIGESDMRNGWAALRKARAALAGYATVPSGEQDRIWKNRRPLAYARGKRGVGVEDGRGELAGSEGVEGTETGVVRRR